MASSNREVQDFIDLNKILKLNDSNEIKRMQNEFETNGWCFVLLTTELILDKELVKDISDFFSFDDDKDKYSQSAPIYGYSKINHREGIKLLTGNYFIDFAYISLVPISLLQPLNYLSQVLDAATKRLIEVLDQHCVFQNKPSLSNLIEQGNLPLEEQHFGMLDIVSYFNEKFGFQPPENGQSTEEVNCVPHYDPGLLSISILSTYEGLQLKNMITNEWIDGPLESNIGVIWLGEAASRITENRLKPGIHRVIYPRESKRRLTIWYELCTIEQLKSISDEKKDELMLEETVIFRSLHRLNGITVLPGEKRLEFLKRIEMGFGLSMSKFVPRYHLEKHNILYPTEDLKTLNHL
ncbi:unnamed protein product [Rotaria sp. Silwood1]|nr:unnamed protein product [Rotaria sp. Silwood1]CAF3673916.1 unnamed protein product [Rotaria sp. Silwood1]CAF3717178.1 unnamed protein product [Rotaria sp. Silwood1]CAF4889579.1 unnamed protein product [Rotaria sp. Silwood1]CAF4909621.1 unnamed protein product [Rotaria sp. Silwood1]